ncbi:peptidylprolyl isomerase [Sporosarcina sp. NPDC096371]|uniref:peptidylprolyl isomerase n=1 Tax=Sporosarcina sp. NPDC096371 TaxID=3364530 RepID=UPI0037F8B3C7
MKKRILASILTASVLGLGACSPDKAESGKAESSKADSDIIVALGADKNINKEDFYEELKKLYGKQVLEKMVTEAVLSEKFKVTNEEVDTEIKKIKEELGDDYLAWLAQRGFTDEDLFRDFARLGMLSDKAILADIEVSEDEIKKRYDKLKTEVKAQHILVKDEETAVKAKAEIDGGAKFADVAKKYSTDKQAGEDGDLGYFSTGKMVPEFEDAAFSMEIDQVSDPVQSSYGFHVIKVTDKRDVEGVKAYEEMKEDLQRELQSEKVDPTTAQEKISNLIKEANIDVKADEFENLFEDVK